MGNFAEPSFAGLTFQRNVAATNVFMIISAFLCFNGNFYHCERYFLE
jgi:hypothetical protein